MTRYTTTAHRLPLYTITTLLPLHWEQKDHFWMIQFLYRSIRSIPNEKYRVHYKFLGRRDDDDDDDDDDYYY
jgi:hypothetical protein